MITDNQIKEILVSNAIEWNKEESQDRAFIYVDDFVKELQAKLKLLGIADVVGRSEQLFCPSCKKQGGVEFTKHCTKCNSTFIKAK